MEKLVYFNLFFYDFNQCYFNLLKNINFQFPSDLDVSDKIKRNIFIGKLQKENKYIYNYLSNTVDKLIDFYISENFVKEENIIVRQKDGLILNKKLDKTDIFLQLNFKYDIDFLIKSIELKEFLYSYEENIVVKGVSKIYDKLFIIYNKFNNLNFLSKKILFSQLQNIKDSVFKQEKDFYLIPSEKNIFLIKTKKGFIKINTFSKIKYDIDKNFYFEHYFKKFCDSIFLTYF